jgi:hypothetical protein
VIALTAAPAADWQVDKWSGTDNDASTATTNFVTMPAHDYVVSVAYIPSSITELYLPLAAFECYHSVGEEGQNNSIDEAFGPFCLGAIFFGLPDDKEDYLFFELNTETAVTIGLPVRPATIQQLQLYRGSTKALRTRAIVVCSRHAIMCACSALNRLTQIATIV